MTGIEFVDLLPRSGAGKIDTKELSKHHVH